MAFIRNLVFYPLFYGFSAMLVIVSVVAIPFGREQLRKVVALWGRWHLWCVQNILDITIVQEGVIPDEPVLIAVKHESFFEAIDMPRLFGFPTVFAKRELFLIPGWGTSARIYGLIPVARDKGAGALRAMIATAKLRIGEGRPLVIFPEGTRVKHGDCPPLQSGFAGIYKLLGLPVVPIAVDSGPLYHGFIKQPGTITYRIGEKIPAGLKRDEIEERVRHAINFCNSFNVSCFSAIAATRKFEVNVAASEDQTQGSIHFVGEVCPMGKGKWLVCRLTALYQAEEFVADASDFFSALQAVRTNFLEPRGIIPQCYGASINIWPSGMARDMGLGMSGYVRKPGHQATELRGIFESGADMEPALVKEQSKFVHQWLGQ